MEMRAIARYWLFPTPPTPTLHSRCSLDVHINLTRIAISLFNAVAHKGGGRKEGGGEGSGKEGGEGSQDKALRWEIQKERRKKCTI